MMPRLGFEGNADEDDSWGNAWSTSLMFVRLCLRTAAHVADEHAFIDGGVGAGFADVLGGRSTPRHDDEDGGRVGGAVLLPSDFPPPADGGPVG